ncbi:MAG TPA: phage tail protein [Burkholderiales bacterium]|jgi:phage tail-like protein
MSYYPPPAFHFAVRVPSLAPNDHDSCFSDVGGLSMEVSTEEVPEGGENRFVQKYPVRAKYPELVLKRGLLVRSALFDWIRDAIQDFAILPRDVDVVLLDAEHQPLFTWHLVNAYATKWQVNDLNASANSVSVEALQLFYQYFTVDRSAAAAARP